MSEYPVPPNPAPDGLLVTPVWTTITTPFDAMTEQRKAKQVFAKYDVSLKYPEGMTNADIMTLWAFYMARRGAYQAFYIYDLLSQAHVGLFVGWGDGTTTTFDLPGKSTSGQTIYKDGLALDLSAAGVSGSMTLEELFLVLADAHAGAYISSGIDLSDYLYHLFTFTDSASKQVTGYLSSIGTTPGVRMTHAGSGSTGIAVPDNANVDAGVSPFALFRRLSLPDWTPASNVTIVFKRGTGSGANYRGYILQVLTTGKLRLYLYRDDTGTNYFDSTVATGFTDGTEHTIWAVVVQETATTAGSVTFYADNQQLGDTVSMPAASPITLDNTSDLYVSGTTQQRTASVNKDTYFLNFAPTLAEIIDANNKGIPESWKWGSQTSLVDPAASVFTSGTYGWTKYGNNVVANDTNQLKITYVDNSGGAYWYMRNTGDLTKDLTPYKKYRVVCDAKYSGGSAGVQLQVNGTGLTTVTSSALTTDYATYVLDFYCNITDAPYLRLINMSAGNEVYIDNLYVYQIGVTLALESTGIGATDWQDSSDNNLDGAYPAAGSEIVLLHEFVSTVEGATRNWTSKESGFDPADTSGYDYGVAQGSILTGGGAEDSDRISLAPAPALGKLITCDLTGYLRMRVRFKEDKFSRQSLTHLISAGGTIELKGLSPEDL